MKTNITLLEISQLPSGYYDLVCHVFTETQHFTSNPLQPVNQVLTIQQTFDFVTDHCHSLTIQLTFGPQVVANLTLPLASFADFQVHDQYFLFDYQQGLVHCIIQQLPTCKLAGCVQSPHFPHPYCSKSHAILDTNRNSPALCQLSGCTLPCFMDSTGKIYRFCSKEHSRKYKFKK